MANTAVLAIRIIADATKATKTMDATSKKAGKWGKAMNAGAAVGAAGLAGLVGIAGKSVKGAAEDAAAQKQLELALKKSAGATDEQVASTEDYITKTTLASGVADDKLRPALGDLVRATGNVGTAQQALNTALDVSAATGQDVTTVSKAMAKGYKGQTKGLGKLGLGLDQATLKAGNMGEIMGDISNTVGGASAEAAGTAAGQYARLQVSLNETQETLGGALLPALTAVLGFLLPMISALSQNQRLVVILAAAFGILSAALVGVKIYMMATTKGTLLNTAATYAATAATWAWNAAMKALRIAVILMKAAFASSPLGVIILAVIALVAVFILAYKKVKWFRDGVNAAMRFVLMAIRAVWDWVKKNWPLLLVILTGPIGAAVVLVVKNLDKIKSAFHTVFTAIGKFISPVVDLMKTLWDWVQKVIDMLGKIKIPHLPDLNPFSKAGPVPVAGPAVVGLRSVGGTPGAGSTLGSATNINVWAVDPQQTARLIQRLVHNADVRAGRKRLA